MKRILPAFIAGLLLLITGFIAGMIIESSNSNVRPQDIASFVMAFRSGELKQYDNVIETIEYLGKPSFEVRVQPEASEDAHYVGVYSGQHGGVFIYVSGGVMHSVLLFHASVPAQYEWLCFDEARMDELNRAVSDAVPTEPTP